MELVIHIKIDLALNNLQSLICYKTQQTNSFGSRPVQYKDMLTVVQPSKVRSACQLSEMPKQWAMSVNEEENTLRSSHNNPRSLLHLKHQTICVDEDRQRPEEAYLIPTA